MDSPKTRCSLRSTCKAVRLGFSSSFTEGLRYTLCSKLMLGKPSFAFLINAKLANNSAYGNFFKLPDGQKAVNYPQRSFLQPNSHQGNVIALFAFPLVLAKLLPQPFFLLFKGKGAVTFEELFETWRAKAL